MEKEWPRLNGFTARAGGWIIWRVLEKSSEGWLKRLTDRVKYFMEELNSIWEAFKIFSSTFYRNCFFSGCKKALGVLLLKLLKLLWKMFSKLISSIKNTLNGVHVIFILFIEYKSINCEYEKYEKKIAENKRKNKKKTKLKYWGKLLLFFLGIVDRSIWKTTFLWMFRSFFMKIQCFKKLYKYLQGYLGENHPEKFPYYNFFQPFYTFLNFLTILPLYGDFHIGKSRKLSTHMENSENPLVPNLHLVQPKISLGWKNLLLVWKKRISPWGFL